MAKLPSEIYKRGRKLHYRFYLNNVEFRGSLRTEDLTTAKLGLAEVKKSIVLGTYGLKKMPTFSEVAQKWLDTNSNIFSDSHIRTAKIFFTKHLNPIIGEYTLDRIDTAIISKLMNDFCSNHAKGSGNALRKYLNIVFNHAIDLGLIKDKPYKTKKFKIPQKQRTLAEIQDLKPFVNYCYDNHNSKHHQTATMIALSLFIGPREQDVLSAKWDWFNETAKTLTITAIKTGSVRVVSLPEYVVNKIVEYQKASGLALGLMFPGRKGKQHPRGFIYWAITRLAKKYGLVGPTPFGSHSCRHSFITMHHDQGTPLGDISKMVGHKRLETTAGYIQSSTKNQIAAQDRLAEAAGMNTRTKTGTATTQDILNNCK